MKKITKVITVTLAMSLLVFLSGCVVTPKDAPKGEDAVVSEKTEDELPMGDVKLELGEMSKINPEEIEAMFGEDMEMIQRFNDFSGKKAPDFEVTDLKGEKVQLSDYEGEDIILEFMGTWCPACDSASFTNDTFNKESDNAKIISVGFNDTEETINDFIKKNDLSATDFLIANESIIQDYQVFFVPLYVFIDKEGYVQMLLAGDAPLQALEEYADKSFN